MAAAIRAEIEIQNCINKVDILPVPGFGQTVGLDAVALVQNEIGVKPHWTPTGMARSPLVLFVISVKASPAMEFKKDIAWKTIAVDAMARKEQRLDVWLTGQVAGLSRRRAQGMIAAGQVLVNGRLCTKGQLLGGGEEVAILSAPVPRRFAPCTEEAVFLQVLLDDARFIVVDKPSGIPSVPLSPEERGTLAGAVAARFPECAAVGRRAGDGGLVQRLDKETSGVVLAARSQEAHDYFRGEQQAGRVEKRYLALVPRVEKPLPSVIDTPLVPSGQRGRMMRPSEDGLAAETRVEVVTGKGAWLLVRASIRHGVRHQIRAHLASVGAPVAGDPLYGGNARPDGLHRLFLHAHEIAFPHPVDRESVVVVSPLPPELARVMEQN